MEWEVGYQVPEITALPARDAFAEAVTNRRQKSSHPCFVLAHIIDIRLWIPNDKGGWKPDVSIFEPNGQEIQQARELLKRMAGGDAAHGIDREFIRLCAFGHGDDAIGGVIKAAEVVDGWKLIGDRTDVELIWSFSLINDYPLFSAVAKRIIGLHPTSCGVERLWSILRNVHRENRSRMAAEKTKKIVFIQSQEKLRHEREDLDNEPPQEYLIESMLGF